MTKRKRRHGDVLDKPIRMPRWTGDEDDPIWRDELKRRQHEKAIAYFKHFDIDPTSPDRWEQLAFKLGDGFHLDARWRSRGGQMTIGPLAPLGLLSRVDTIKRDEGIETDKAALRVLLERWYESQTKKPKPKDFAIEVSALQKMLSRARKRAREKSHE